MAIFIGKEEKTEEDATALVSEPDDLVRQIVRAWHQSNVKHHFECEKCFKEAVRKNQKALKSAQIVKALFKRSNYRFSTKANGRKETMYFENCVTKQTGRLRQQHRHGPLVKIDKKAKIHRFLSKKRFEYVRKWRKQHDKNCLPCFYICEQLEENGKHHIEFAYEEKEVSGWHRSGGTVRTSKQHLQRRLDSALKEILGIRHK
jgi:hypothetical protein